MLILILCALICATGIYLARLENSFDCVLIQMYRTRYDKLPFDARCCHLANGLINITGDRQTNEWTNRRTEKHRRRIKPAHLRGRLNNGRTVQLNPLIATLKPQSNEPSYGNTVIGTLAVDGWAVTFGTARRGLGGAS